MPAPGAIASYAYTVDASGHRTAVAELSGRTVSYGYDNLYRLTSETIASDTHAMNGAANYVYDPVGNRAQKTSTLPGYPGGLSNYNANDQLATDTYDANGNTTASIGNGYVYDFENHLIQAGGVTYTYDGDGNRMSKTVAGVTTQYLVDPQSPTGYAQVVEDWVVNGWPSVYAYGLEQISVHLQGRGVDEKLYYVHDGHGSVRALTDATGTVTDTYEYDAFGNLLHSGTTLSSPTPNNYLFAGEQFDPDLGLYYNRARYLNTSTGRFWSLDSEEGNDEAPLSLHKYLHSQDDPVNNVDPSGIEVDGLIAASLSVTLDSMPSLNFVQQVNAALPIPDFPASLAGRQLVGAVYAESSTKGKGGGESADEKLAIAETFIYEAFIGYVYPNRWNTPQFGHGTLWEAIKINSVAVGQPEWNEVMTNKTSTADLKNREILSSTLSAPDKRLHFINSVLAVNQIPAEGGLGDLPGINELNGRDPIAFKGKGGGNPNPRRMEKIAKIGGTTFYAFKPGREQQ